MKHWQARLGPIALTFAAAAAFASSHREAPFVAFEPRVDGTDLYMFRSYEPGREGFMTVIADYIPFQQPQSGPNFYFFDPNAMYEIHLDNNGDAAEDITFQFRFNNDTKALAVPVGGETTTVPLINIGPLSGLNPEQLNLRETYKVNVVRGDRRTGTAEAVTNANGGGATFDKPVDYIGVKSFANGYENYARLHLYNINVPGCPTQGRMFVGQRKEPFYIAIGKFFDLLNLNPVAEEVNGNNNDLENENITTIALELPIDCVTGNSGPVVGAWTTASVRQARLIDPSPAEGLNTATVEGGPFAQVSRLGNPLVNELVIGLPSKNQFNASHPRNDSQFLNFVQRPAIPELIQMLFPQTQAPNNFPRSDLVATYLTGIPGVNKPANVTPSEMLRLNTSTPPTPIGQQSVLGVAGNDLAGFPNGRRPADDVVDITMRVAMGALCQLTGPKDMLQVGCGPSDAPSGALPLTDGVRRVASTYQNQFPYLNTPIRGNFNPANTVPPPNPTR